MIRTVKPTTSGQRGISYEDRHIITVSKPNKKLTSHKKRISGRDEFGRISIRHRGGGAKRQYRLVDFSSGNIGQSATVETIEYDPNRNARIALIRYNNDEKRYIVAPQKIDVGQNISFDDKTRISVGNRCLLEHIPTGVSIHNIELTPSSKAKIVRSAGTQGLILSKDELYAHIKLPSGEVRKFNLACRASIGQVSNIEHKTITVGKAGRMRHMGKRPTVRGKVMSTRSHPHGGGEASNSIGLKYPKTPWGKHALGVRTRDKHKPSSILIVKRRSL